MLKFYYKYALILCVSVITIFIAILIMSSCGSYRNRMPVSVPESVAIIPTETTYIYQSDSFSIIVLVKPSLKYRLDKFVDGLARASYGPQQSKPHLHFSGAAYGFVNENGQVVIPLMYGWAEHFRDGLAIVGMPNEIGGGKYGFIDKTGQVIIPLIYDGVNHFWGDDVALVERRDSESGNNTFAYIDKTGQVVTSWVSYRDKLMIKPGAAEGITLPPKGTYDYQANYYCDDRAIVAKDNMSGFIDKNGTEVIPLIYDVVYDFREGLARVIFWTESKKYGFIDKEGNIIANIEYDGAFDFMNGFARVRKDGKWGFIDKTGMVVVPLIYDDVQYFQDGFAAVTNNDEGRGIINETGDVVVPLIYDYVGNFQDGFAVVKKENKLGYVDMNGNVAIPLEYQFASSFRDGLAIVGLNNKFGCIDKSGEIVIPLEYEQIYFNEELFTVRKENRSGIYKVIRN